MSCNFCRLLCAPAGDVAALIVTLLYFIYVSAVPATAASGEERLAAAQEMLEQMHSLGVVTQVRLAADSGAGLSLRATGDFKEGDVLITMPGDHTISSGSLDKKLKGVLASSQKEQDSISWRMLLCSQLLLEARRGSQSRLRGYLQFLKLTEVPPSPGEFSSIQQVALQSTNMRVRLDEFKDWHKFMLSLGRTRRGASLFQPPLQESELSWAWGISTSRVMEIGGHNMLVPLVDMANHGDRSHRNVEQAWASVDGAPVVTLTATRNIAAGEELILWYGPWDHIKFLVDYGFLPQPDKHGNDFVDRALPDTDAALKEVCSWYLSTVSATFSACRPVPETLLKCLFLSKLPSAQAVRRVITHDYRRLVHEKPFATLDCTEASSAKACAVNATGKMSKLALGELREWLKIDFGVLKYVADFCGKEAASLSGLRTSADWVSLRQDDTAVSKGLTVAIEHCHKMQQRCVHSMRARMKRTRELRKQVFNATYGHDTQEQKLHSSRPSSAHAVKEL